jgi:predicted anti-sigma-YlaC factor YlaD
MTRIPLDLTCREVVELVTDYLEGHLTPEARTRFELHLVYCDGCRTYVRQLRQVLTTTGKLTEESVPPDMRDSLLRAFGSWKKAGGGGV